MGGNAIKKVTISRISIIEYSKLKQDIINIFNKRLELHFFHDVPNKTDFGDLDICYVVNPNINLYELIIQLFNPVEIVSNGDVISIGYKFNTDNEFKYFQVDFIKCSQSCCIPMYQLYFSYGDVGGIIGRIVKYYRMTFGFNGLRISLNYSLITPNINTNNASDQQLILSSNCAEICKFLTLDYEQWLNGFTSITEIYQWIMKCKFYNPIIFDNLNHDHKERAADRMFYKGFVNYIKTDKNHYDKIIVEQQLLIEQFGKTNELDIIKKKYIRSQDHKFKFNGKKLIKFGIDNIKIGKFIKEFSKTITNFDEWLDFNDVDFIDEYVKNYITTQNNIIN